MKRHFIYVNRKGRRYYLRAIPTAKGKTRYVFSRETASDALYRLPAGFVVRESVNGVVSLARKRDRLVRDGEVEVVRSVLAAESRLARYAVEERKDAIWVFEPLGPSPEEISKIYRIPLDRAQQEPVTGQYTPIFRFMLFDPVARTFYAERMCFLGGESWMGVHRPGPLRKLASMLLPHLGQESFFELF